MSAKELLDALKRDQDRKKEKTRISRLVMVEDGSYLVRFLPNNGSQSGLPYERVFLHFGFNHPDFGTASTFRCLGRGCPLCREAKKMAEDGASDSWKYKSTPVYLYYVADKDDNLMFLRLSAAAHSKVVEEISSKATSNVDPIDLDQGRVAEIVLEKQSDGPRKWRCLFHSGANKVSDKVKSELESSPPLSKFYRSYTKQELENVVSGKSLKKIEESGDSLTDSYTQNEPSSEVVDSIEARKAKIRAQLESED